MRIERVARNEAAAVVACRTPATAEMVATMLAAHGIQAWAEPLSIYPSLEWVEGRAVIVSASDAAEARRVLENLDTRSDVRPVGSAMDEDQTLTDDRRSRARGGGVIELPER